MDKVDCESRAPEMQYVEAEPDPGAAALGESGSLLPGVACAGLASAIFRGDDGS
jgi:hypothetical protein